MSQNKMKTPNKKEKTPLLSLHLNVYNEQDNLENVYKECRDVLKKAKISYEMIFVEGGSSDCSWKVLKKLAAKNKNCRVFQAEMEPGKKLNAGMRVAKGKYFGYLCSDGQDDPNILPECIRLLEKDKADFVKGRRIDRQYWQRKFISRVYNRICRLLFGIKLKDVNMHPKVFKRDLVKDINLISKGESVDLEIVLRAKQKGYRMMELPLQERDREGGKSSVNLIVALKMIRDMLSYKWGSKGKAIN
ncbi:MAG: glycosyltransferase family 2 protein [Actinobacteria bacterium]|nr:glycosyltransferase family 2 protein [Actinomycetota bacterium]